MCATLPPNVGARRGDKQTLVQRESVLFIGTQFSNLYTTAIDAGIIRAPSYAVKLSCSSLDEWAGDIVWSLSRPG